MSNESPPGSSRPRAGGEFTWPPTSDELDAIEVIPLDSSPSATTTPPATRTPSASTSPVSTSSVTTSPVTTSPVNTAAVAPVLPPSHPVPAAARAISRRQRPRVWMRRPTRDDLVYAGVTLTSALAIAVAGAQQLSDWWRTPFQPQAGAGAPLTASASPGTSPAVSAATSPATSPVANVALLQLFEKGPADMARAAANATIPPVTAIADAAASIAPAAKAGEARARRAVRGTTRSQHNVYARRATRATNTGGRAARGVAPREPRVRAATAAAIASPPLRLPESYVQPRLVSQEGGRRRGQVVLAVHVRPNGRVGDVEVLSKGDDRVYDELERAAVSAVKRWRYRPALRDGVPTPARVKVVVNFS